jgi:ribosomal protein L24
MAITYAKTVYTSSKPEMVDTTVGIGATLRVWEGEIQVMSDVWDWCTFATYWDEEAGLIRKISYVKSATVDATPEALAKVKAYFYSLALEEAQREAAITAAAAGKGDTVTVTSGRFNLGTTGKVVATVQKPYGMGYRAPIETKFGIALTDEKVKVKAANGKVYENYKDVIWVWARNCSLAEARPVDTVEVAARAARLAETRMNKALAKAA